LAAGSVETWPGLEQKFHDYFCKGEVELRLSDLTAIRTKYNETTAKYLEHFRETRTCVITTIGKKDLADLAYAGLALYLREKLEGHEFTGMNHVLQKAMVFESHTKDGRAYGRFKDGSNREKDKSMVNFVDDESVDDGDAEICVTEWVETPNHKPISCSFLKPNGGKKDEIKYTFDVSKCDKLFDMLIQGG
jgi:hypothetical protein